MSQSLSRLYVHIVFHIKGNTLIRENDSPQLYAYIAGILKAHHSLPIQINGTSNHVHILCVMSKNISLAALVQQVKASSSSWIKTLDDNCYTSFAWQKGYAGFSVSPSIHDKTVQYILNQQEHHKKMSFKDELLMFLREYQIEYDERYVWLDD